MKLTYFASRASSSFRTDACISADAINASGTAQAWLWWTLVYIYTAIWSRETLCTGTSKPSRAWFTRSTIMTRLTLALINWFSTKSTTPAIAADAHWSCFTADDCWRTRATIRTLSTITLCYSLSARFTYKLPHKMEHISILSGEHVQSNSATLTWPSRSTFACKFSVSIQTHAVIFAWIRQTIIEIYTIGCKIINSLRKQFITNQCVRIYQSSPHNQNQYLLCSQYGPVKP